MGKQAFGTWIFVATLWLALNLLHTYFADMERHLVSRVVYHFSLWHIYYYDEHVDSSIMNTLFMI